MTNTSSKRGRKPKPYRATDGQYINGLYHCPDGRWRLPNGQKFTEHDEAAAIRRFKQWVALQASQVATVQLPLTSASEPVLLGTEGNILDVDTAEFVEVGEIAQDNLLRWAKKQIEQNLVWFANAIGHPALVNYNPLEQQKRSVTLAQLWEAYAAREDVNDTTMKNTKSAWTLFVKRTGVATLAELTTPVLVEFDRWLSSQKHWSPEYRSFKIKKIRAVISNGKKHGLDPTEIREAMDRLVVVKLPKIDLYDAKPITKTDWQTLYAAAKKPLHKAMILLGLNAALYLKDLHDLTWRNIDLDQGTLTMRRKKTGFRRLAVLWPETVAALKSLPSAGNSDLPVFRSSHGTAYAVDSLRHEFNEIRPGKLTFNQLRDGAFTAAARAGVPIQLCQMVAGHATAGQSDKYLARIDPYTVKPATDAIYATYMA